MHGGSNMYVAICDDETAHISYIEEYLVKLKSFYPSLKWKIFNSAEKTLEFYLSNGNKFDILITDIEMDNINGVDLANIVRKRDQNVIIFFLTSHKEYAIQCFKAEPMNFWLKPLSFDVIETDFKRAYKRINQSQEFITITENRQSYDVKYCNIIYLEKWERKTIIHTKAYEYKTNKSLTNFQSELDPNVFVRVNQSYIVNMQYIKKYSDTFLQLKENIGSIQVGRNYLFTLRKKFIQYKERRMLE